MDLFNTCHFYSNNKVKLFIEFSHQGKKSLSYLSYSGFLLWMLIIITNGIAIQRKIHDYIQKSSIDLSKVINHTSFVHIFNTKFLLNKC